MLAKKYFKKIKYNKTNIVSGFLIALADCLAAKKFSLFISSQQR
jgi:hypothetical protein